MVECARQCLNNRTLSFPKGRLPRTEPEMSAKGKDFKCLICQAAIPHAHKGIDACRACGIFYKRSISHKYALLCTCGEEPSTSKGKIVSCRKCRFERFKEIFEKANAGGIACYSDEPISVSMVNQISDSCQNDNEQPNEIHEGCSSQHSVLHIDHTSSIKCNPALNDTPILDKMKRAYCTLCQVRKAGEMSALHHQTMHAQIRNDEMILRPAKYADFKPYSQIFFIGLIDFAKSTFNEFHKMTADDRHHLVQSNFRLIQSLDRSYRAYFNYPNDDTVMATYSTYMNDESIVEFFVNCPPDVKKTDAIQLFRDNMRLTLKKGKFEFSHVKPTIDEFMVLFGLAFWNDYTVSLGPEMTRIATNNREALLKELKTVYRRRGVTEYAPRMGELLCLLSNEEASERR